MKHQEVSVDYWMMAKTMLIYGVISVMGWVMLRMFNTVFMLPRRMRDQQENMQATLQELQRRYPALNITEEDLKDAEKEFKEWKIESDLKNSKSSLSDNTETPAVEEDKKTI